jgi:hypothetical protein
MDTHKISSIVEIHGPTLTTQQTLLPTTSWIRVVDHYDPVALDLYLDQQDCQHTKIFQDFFWLPVDSCHKTFFAPLWLDVFCKFSLGKPVLSETVSTSDCFNFMMYKPRLLRQHVVAELAKRNLKTDSYTYSGTCDFVNKITPKYFGPARQMVYNNTADYNNFLREHVFDRSAVALITETIEPEWSNNMTFTEKTLWAMLSLNFPIWLGGRLQAELWQNVGFDTFDDVVDQTYQYESDPKLRIQLALDNNIKLLTDLQYATALRNQMLDRLKRNRELVLTGAIKRYTDQLLSSIHETCPALFKR